MQIGPGTRRTKASLRFSPSHPHIQGELCSPGRGHPRFSCTSDSSCLPPPLPRAFLRMLFPEKLDVDKKGRPSTAGSKIKVGLGRRGGAGAGGGAHWGLFSTRSAVCLSCILAPRPRHPLCSRIFFQLWGY